MAETTFSIESECVNTNGETRISYRNQIIGGLGCALVHVSVGVLIGFTGVTLPEMMNPPLEKSLVLSEKDATFFVGALSVGSILGSLLGGPLLLRVGQRKAMLFCLPCLLLWWIILSRAPYVSLMISCRVLQGVMNAILSAASQAYATEVCHPNIRGRILGSLDLLRQIGYLFVYLVGSSSLGWRNVALATGVTSPIMPFLILLAMPDSPRWLATKNRYEQAKKSLTFFRGSEFDVNKEFTDIVEELSNPSKKLKMMDQVKLLRNKSLAIVFVVLCACNFLQHSIGLFSIYIYGAIIFESASESVDAYFCTILTACATSLGSFAFLLSSDRHSRRACILIPHLLSVLLITTLGCYFYFQESLATFQALKLAPVICSFLYSVFAGMANPAIGCMRAELLPTEFRSLGINIVFTFFYGGMCFAAMTFFMLNNAFGMAGTFWSYSIVGSVLFFLVFFFLPETKGKTLENINVMKSK